MNLDWMIGLAGVALMSQAGSRLVLKYARSRQLLDIPGERRPHERPTPRGGGLGLAIAVCIAITLGYFLGFVEWRLSLVGAVSTLTLGIIGWLDDSRGLGIMPRLLVQLLMAIAAVILLPPVSGVLLPGAQLLLAGVLLGLCLVWCTNLYNFMDGSHGLATTQAIFAGAVLALGFYQAGSAGAFWCAAALCAASIGFLPLNFPRPRVFLGDSGSTVLGFLLGLLSWEGLRTGAFDISLPLLALAPFIADASLTLSNRVFRRQRWYNAHTEHAYQRMMALGFSHTQVWLVFQGLNALALALILGIRAEFMPLAGTIIGFYGLLFVFWLMVYRRSRRLESRD